MNNQPKRKVTHYGKHHIPLLLRKILAEAFPEVKFKAYVKGRNLLVSWADGPTEEKVMTLLFKFQKKLAHQGKRFVLIDYKNERYSLEIDMIIPLKEYSTKKIFEAEAKFRQLKPAAKSKIMAMAPHFSEIIKNMFLVDYFFGVEPKPSKTLEACKFA